MENLTLKQMAIPMIKAIDSFNYLLKSHHRRVAVAAYYIGKELQLDQDELLRLVISAGLHDIGALSVHEKNSLVKEDVSDPDPHCIMGYRMLSSFSAFKEVSRIIRHHHVKFNASPVNAKTDIPFQSYILHFADRLDIYISKEEFILDQKQAVTEKLRQRTGKTLHPEVFEAFLKASKGDIFWIEIDNLSIDKLFSKLDFTLDYQLKTENIIEFAITISRIIDFRSRFTAAHSYTVGNIAMKLGKDFGLSDEKCIKLLIAGLLHDIGKIGINPGLIEKNGKLTENEFNLIKLHPYYTGQILSELHSSEWFREIIHWVERHHEKNNGNGYPYALNDDQLDLEGKLLSFSDVIAALTEERPYRSGQPINLAMTIIEEQLAPYISLEIFEKIAPHKTEIANIVKQCQQQMSREYSLPIQNI